MQRIGMSMSDMSLIGDDRDDRDALYMHQNNQQNQRHMIGVEEEEKEEEEVQMAGVAASLPPRGILLVGNVSGASNVPTPTTATATDGSGGGHVFFKVLFVEGGKQSTMFRCKTPIFTSAKSKDLQFPHWDKGMFRFEMVLPEGKDEDEGDIISNAMGGSVAGNNGKDRRLPPSVRAKQAAQGGSGKKQRVPFEVRGEILVAVYQTREGGGNDFVGQVTFDLAEIASSGTTAFPIASKKSRGTQVRTVSGSFPVLARGGNVAGNGLTHLDVQVRGCMSVCVSL